MWKLIGLFSLFLFLSFAQQIRREFDVDVELTGKLLEEKPKLYAPARLEMQEDRELDLLGELLEAPKLMEFTQIKPIERNTGVSCGEPKDAISYRLGVDYYLRGKYDLAEEELKKVIVMNSPFKPMAEYVLGVISYSRGQQESALELFKTSCGTTHMYQKASCEAYYALNFRIRNSVPENQDPMWRAVFNIKRGVLTSPECEEAVFIQYCGYIKDFLMGKENSQYRDSTRLARALRLYREGNLREAKPILSDYSKPARPYRDIALYYMALTDIKEGKVEEALRLAGLLETVNRRLADNLYGILSSKDVVLSRYVYSLTRNPRFLEKAGIIAYNSGDYSLALYNFLQAGSSRYAVYSAIRLGNYDKVYGIIKDKREKSREDYLWLLEALYWSGRDMTEALNEVSRSYLDLYKEYSGWERFRRGDWLGALSFFEDPYHRALALYNLKRYGEVLNILRGRADHGSRLLQARAALMMGDQRLARTFLTDKSDEESYLLGLSYFLEGNYTKALLYFDKVSDQSPMKPKALIKAGDSLYNMGDIQSAKDRYYQVLRRFPDSKEARSATLALLEIGEKELSDKEMEGLIKDYLSKEGKSSPISNELRYQLALLYIKDGRTREAERELLELLETPLRFKAILKLAEIEKEPPKKAVLLYKVYKEGGPEESRLAREELVKLYTQAGDAKSLAGLLSEGSREDKVKAMGIYLGIKELGASQSLAQELMSVGYRSQEFERYLLELYKGTNNRLYLDYLKDSPEKNTRAEALYLSALDHMRRGDKSKALEELVDISVNHRDYERYNQAILEGTRLLVERKARKDASCFLERFDEKRAKPEELSLYRRFKQELPKCEVR
ncbi:MAG: hypothetical protein D6674_03020 [Acidobacteria bacterium]|jgi:TolA-binding protein|nr:MAG: hypothetical protein D6674_03020 [Acidobacteriota bacterium]